MGVADVTDESSRSLGYGLVTAGFAASLIISPALGAGIELLTGSDEAVVILASLVALLDVFFIVIFVPESLLSEQKMAIKSLTFQQMNPFASLRGIWSDRRVLLMSMVAVLSYLPEAGQSTCFFVYLTLVLGFSPMMVGVFICYVGVLSTIFQTRPLQADQARGRQEGNPGRLVRSTDRAGLVRGQHCRVGGLGRRTLHRHLIGHVRRHLGLPELGHCQGQAGCSPGDAHGGQGSLQRVGSCGIWSSLPSVWHQHSRRGLACFGWKPKRNFEQQCNGGYRASWQYNQLQLELDEYRG